MQKKFLQNLGLRVCAAFALLALSCGVPVETAEHPGEYDGYIPVRSTISTGEELETKLQEIFNQYQTKSSYSPSSGITETTETTQSKHYLITLTGNVEISPQNLINIDAQTKITFFGDENERVISLKPGKKGSLFAITGLLTLVLDNNITLKGIGGVDGTREEANDSPLVKVKDYAVFIMNSGSKICGNKNINIPGRPSERDPVYNYGGGVMVYNNGNFKMNGGEISGNSTQGYGGGVVVYKINENINAFNYARFVMNSGKIIKNEATLGGGGVDVQEYLHNYPGDACFEMNGGEISENKAGFGGGVSVGNHEYIGFMGRFKMNGGEISENKAGSGGGVCIRGVFEMTGGTIRANEAFRPVNDSPDVIPVRGGGIDVDDGYLTISGGEIMNNTAIGCDGEFDDFFGRIYFMSGCNGGGVYLHSTVKYEKTGGFIYGNDQPEKANKCLNNENYQPFQGRGAALYQGNYLFGSGWDDTM
ncbi:MAG: hypothetical protein LBG72_01230 [Spirochaetaceae bacterium]|jgi:hypothetical protein|nr:hypothetical protein [Spirochaetaceae bacterium]